MNQRFRVHSSTKLQRSRTACSGYVDPSCAGLRRAEVRIHSAEQEPGRETSALVELEPDVWGEEEVRILGAHVGCRETGLHIEGRCHEVDSCMERRAVAEELAIVFDAESEARVQMDGS